MNYVDPSGHCSVWGDNWCYEENGQSGGNESANDGSDYGLTFLPDSDYEGLEGDTQAFIAAVKQEAGRMFDAYCNHQGNFDCGFDSPAELYLATHDDTVIIFSNSSLDKYCQRDGDSSNVRCGSNSRGKITSIIAAHEMGHVFNSIIKDNGFPLDDPYHDLANERATNPLFPLEGESIAPGHSNNGGSNQEDYANMHSMWVFDEFIDTERRRFMEENMYTWISQMLGY